MYKGDTNINKSILLEKLIEDSEWITRHYDKLRKYEGKIIAVKDKKLYAYQTA